MFEYTLASVQKKRKRGLGYFMVTSLLWLVILSVSIVASIYVYDAKINEELTLITVLAPPPPPPPPPPPAAVTSAPKQQQQVMKIASEITALRQVPSRIDLPPDNKIAFSSGSGSEGGVIGGVEGGVEGGVIGGVIGGVKGGVLGGVLGSTYTAAPPPPPPPPVERAEPVKVSPPPEIVRRSEGVIRGIATYKPVPPYPPLARNTMIQGEVVLDLTISETGDVSEVTIISGPALLQQAALSAAKLWKFKPTLLNNQPVKVKGILTFRFTL